MVWVYVLKSKDHTFEAFKSWKTMIENQKDRKLKSLEQIMVYNFVTKNSLNYVRRIGS